MWCTVVTFRWEETGAWLLLAVPNPASCVLAVTEAIYVVVTGSAAWEEESMDYNGKSLYPKPLTTVAVFSFLFCKFCFLHRVLLCSIG